MSRSPTKNFKKEQIAKKIDLLNSEFEIEKFLKQHEVTQLIFNGNGSLYECYLCQEIKAKFREDGTKKNQKLLTRIKMTEECLPKIQK